MHSNSAGNNVKVKEGATDGMLMMEMPNLFQSGRRSKEQELRNGLPWCPERGPNNGVCDDLALDLNKHTSPFTFTLWPFKNRLLCKPSLGVWQCSACPLHLHLESTFVMIQVSMRTQLPELDPHVGSRLWTWGSVEGKGKVERGQFGMRGGQEAGRPKGRA